MKKNKDYTTKISTLTIAFQYSENVLLSIFMSLLKIELVHDYYQDIIEANSVFYNTVLT